MEKHNLNHRKNCKIIVSCFVDGITSLKEDLSHLVTRMQSTGADLIKLVTNATDITELSRIFHLLSHCQVQLYFVFTIKSRIDKIAERVKSYVKNYFN